MHGLGSKLREIREKRGMTQRTLAERIHKSVSAISGYETDFQTPPTDVLISISQVLHLPIAYLMDSRNEEAYSAAGLTPEQRKSLHIAAYQYRLPKQVMKKVLLLNGDIYPICPRCDCLVDREYLRFCDQCGQRLGLNFLGFVQIVHAPRR